MQVLAITNASYERVLSLMKAHADQHELLAKALMQFETLTGRECIDIVERGKMPNRAIVNHNGGARGNIEMLVPKEEKKRGGSLRAADWWAAEGGVEIYLDKTELV